jgi:hypothetical protein
MKNFRYIIFLMVLLIAVGCTRSKPDVVARLDSEAITKSELKHWMLLEKANVYSYFYRKYKVEDSEHFWTQELGDEIPLEKLKALALEKAKRCKVQQILALEKGITKTANFDEIAEEMKAVNEERRQKLEKGEPIYGPVQFTSRTYFSHVFDKMVIELKNELVKHELKPGEEELLIMQKNAGLASGEKAGFLSIQYVDQHYEAYIDKLTSATHLKVNTDVYDNIRLE